MNSMHPKIVPFYDQKMALVQKNARRLFEHPIFKNLGYIQNQLNDLKQCHRNYLFALFSEKFGEDTARNLLLSPEINKSINDFEDISSATLTSATKSVQQINQTSPLVAKLKMSFYYKPVAPAHLKREILNQAEMKYPDLIAFPKQKKEKAS